MQLHFISSFIFIIVISLTCCLIEIAQYNYPLPNDTSTYTVAIFGSNDLHGKIFPAQLYFPGTNKTYRSGGAEYMYSYIDILRNQWGERFLWLDAGDQYTGGLECMLSDCDIMNMFYNTAKVDGIAIGNHDFDYGVEELKKKISKSEFPYICANLYDKENDTYEVFPGKQTRYKVYNVGKVKIGVIGLITTETPTMSDVNLDMYDFQDYQSIVEELSNYLRTKENVDAVLLLPHFGPKCNDDTNEKLNINIRNKTTNQKNCTEDNEYYEFIKNLNPNIIDAVVAGHVHDVSHHWIHEIPVIESTGSEYSHILYLPFILNSSTNKYDLQRDSIQIEGPLPSCPKVFDNTLRCDYVAEEIGELTEYTFHGMKVELNAEMNKTLWPWKQMVERNLSNVIAENRDPLEIEYKEETALGNIICDGIRAVSGADVAFYNLGGYRIGWYPGMLNDVDVFNMFPFNNTIVSFEMKGSELLRAMKEIQSDNKITPMSGIKQVLVSKAKDDLVKLKLVSLTFFDGYMEVPLDLEKTYVVATNDFVANGGSIFEPVREWYELRNYKSYGTTRDNMKLFLSAVKIINEKDWIDPKNPRSKVLYQP